MPDNTDKNRIVELEEEIKRKERYIDNIREELENCQENTKD